jgi:hypothetical protein
MPRTAAVDLLLVDFLCAVKDFNDDHVFEGLAALSKGSTDIT